MKEEGVVCRFKIGDSIVYRHGDARQKTSTITDAIVDNNGFGIIHIKDDDGEEGRIFMYISKEEIPRIKLGDKFIYTNAKGEGSEVVANAIIHNKDGLANLMVDEAKESQIEPDSVKNDFQDNKLRWDLLPLKEIEDIVRVYHAGAKKYGPNRWQNLEDGFQRYKAAALRHLMEYEKGERVDADTGCLHLAQFAWNAIAMLYLDKHGKGLIKNNEKSNETYIGSRSRRYPHIGDNPGNISKLRGYNPRRSK